MKYFSEKKKKTKKKYSRLSSAAVVISTLRVNISSVNVLAELSEHFTKAIFSYGLPYFCLFP